MIVSECVCGVGDVLPGRTYVNQYGAIRLVRCSKCELTRDPQDHPVEKLYSAESNVYHLPSEEEFEAELPRFRTYAAIVAQHAADTGRMLDVGCNAGQLMLAFRETGWQVKGLDLNSALVDYARRKGLDALTTPLEACGFEDESFDLVTMSHVIEHIPSLIDTLREAHRILKPGGLLFVAVPNFGSKSELLLYGARWPAFLPSQHVWYFTERTLEKTVALGGFQSLIVRANVNHRIDKGTLPARMLKLLFVGWQRLTHDGNELVGLFRKR